MSESKGQISKEKMTVMEQAFKAFDKNDDGRITRDEVRNVLKEMDVDPTEAELDNFMKNVDTDGNGSLDFNEFCAVFKDTLITADIDAMKAIFDEIDENSDGKIQDTELQKALSKAMGGDVELADAQSIIECADRDLDGHINFDEFVVMFHALELAVEEP